MSALPDTRIPFRRARASGESHLRGPEALVLVLVVLALVASWVAFVHSVENSEVNVDPALDKLVMTRITAPLDYAAHGAAIGSVIVAGLLAALLGGFRSLGGGVRLALCVLSATAAIWAVVSYAPREILSAAIFGATGPFVWFSLVFVMAGTDRRIWSYIDPVIRVLSYTTTGLAIRTLMASEWRHYYGFSKYTAYAILLTWLGGWTLLTATRMRGFRLMARASPQIVAMLMAICAQARSWTILSLLILAAFILLRSREQGSAVSSIRALIMGCVLALAAAASVYATIPRTLIDSAQGLSARLDEDTRSGQYTEFFAVVPVADLLLGRGPKGTWYWRGFGEYQYFDNGYLWMLFVGGVPTLLCYVPIVVWPAIRAIRLNPRGADGAAVCLVLLWGLALTGLSTYTLPSTTFNSLLVSLWAGRCHLLLAENAHWKFARARTTSIFRPKAGH